MNLTSDINLPISNLKLKKLIEEYSFLSITEKIHINTEPDIFKKFNESKVISICTYSNGCDTYFFVGFELIVLNVQQSSILFLEELFLSKDELLICFYNEAKSIFDENINIKYKETELDFKKEILAEHVTIKKETKKFVYYLICIMQYLIEKSYIKLAQKDRYVDFDENKIIPKIYNKNDYIDLHITKPGSTFRVRLIYSIEDKDLLIIKEPLCDEYRKN